MPISASFILYKAAKLVDGDRNDAHGRKQDNFQNISMLWSAYLGMDLSPKDVANMMVLLKVARTKTGRFNEDDYIDMAGYAGCGAELHAETTV